MKARTLLFHGIVVVLAIALDQWIKYLVETGLEFHRPVEILPFLALFRTYNTGVAFSMFSTMGDLGLIVVTLLVVVFILFLAWRTDPEQRWARLGYALVLGGAFGNLIDRLLLGHVVDYVLFHTPVWSFAVFNLADAFITIGAALVILEEFLGWRRSPKEPSA